MIHVRGITVENTMRFVKERHGAAAHDRIVASLAPECALSFGDTLRDAAWKPLDHVVAYMSEAQRQLAPGDGRFFHTVGRHSGHITGSSGFRFLIGSSPHTALSRAAFMWRFLYDAGRLEVVEKGPHAITIRIHDFPVTEQLWCSRIAGFLEALLEITGVRDGCVREQACRTAGSPWCEMRGTWAP
jgi:hypothetical protein